MGDMDKVSFDFLGFRYKLVWNGRKGKWFIV
jgi:hypothetical protein